MQNEEHVRILTTHVATIGSDRSSVISHRLGGRAWRRGRVIGTGDTLLVWPFLGQGRLAGLGLVVTRPRDDCIAPYGVVSPPGLDSTRSQHEVGTTRLELAETATERDSVGHRMKLLPAVAVADSASRAVWRTACSLLLCVFFGHTYRDDDRESDE